MEIKSNLCSNATRKIGLLITKASELGMDIGGCGVADENPNSGYVYLWLEDYSFTLYIDLGSDVIKAVWSNPDNGEEEFILDIDGYSLEELESWASDLYQQCEA